jgi:putative aldouronate transport system permease protein
LLYHSLEGFGVRLKKSIDSVILETIGYVVLGGFGLFCILPFILLISGSLTDENVIITSGYTLWPRKITLYAYKAAFAMPNIILDGYKITALITVAGTVLSLFLLTMTAYVMSRKEFAYRNKIAFYFYFTTLFNGGLVSYYIIMIRYYNMKNSLLALILPGLINVFYLLMMRNFITQTVHEALIESARIDGAGDFKIYSRIVLPLLKPAIASIGLFIALGYWNDWYSAMLFVNKEEMYPLQYVLNRILTTAQNMDLVAANAKVKIKLPKESLKLSMTVIATGPIIFAYPFVQKYFVKGITLGGVKG